LEKPSGSESKLVELKAKAEDLDSIRKLVKSLGASYIGKFHQIDTYFEVPRGRLKLREIDGQDEAELIYYEREDIQGPKRSEVFILTIPRPETFKTLFEKVLEKKVVIDKQREIYRYKGTQIHLDNVADLGTFIEFERKSKGSTKAVQKDQEVLQKLMKKLGIENSKLLGGSYSDLANQSKDS
jgi:predicted adenylyl cyclase CyaB